MTDRPENSIPVDKAVQAGIRSAEAALRGLFSTCAPFSAHLYKWSDAALPDMYDHNAFFLTDAPEAAELDAAAAYQRANGLGFLKLESRLPLAPSQQERLGLEEGTTYTMALAPERRRTWKRNPNVEIRDLKQYDIQSDLLAIELANYGSVYGEDFVARKLLRYAQAARECPRLHYYGAYLDGRIAGACYAFAADGYTGMDGLIVDPAARKQYVATTLLSGVIEALGGEAYLHADADDTPRFMYERMGFCLADVLYEYNYKTP